MARIPLPRGFWHRHPALPRPGYPRAPGPGLRAPFATCVPSGACFLHRLIRWKPMQSLSEEAQQASSTAEGQVQGHSPPTPGIH